jgi:Vam6/Vps39-like protein vacuolar protein sorting-associated protein 39
MLPLTTKVSELYRFVEKYIRENNKNRNMNMVVKNLLKADQRQVWIDILSIVKIKYA